MVIINTTKIWFLETLGLRKILKNFRVF